VDEKNRNDTITIAATAAAAADVDVDVDNDVDATTTTTGTATTGINEIASPKRKKKTKKKKKKDVHRTSKTEEGCAVHLPLSPPPSTPTNTVIIQIHDYTGSSRTMLMILPVSLTTNTIITQ